MQKREIKIKFGTSTFVFLGIATILVILFYWHAGNLLDDLNYKYEWRTLHLNNSNAVYDYGQEGEFNGIVKRYLCTDGVFVMQWPFDDGMYFSTWVDAQVHSGDCLIKLKVKK